MENLARRIGAKLREARDEKRLTQEDMAAQLGIGRAGYSNIETGRSLITVEHLLKLPAILGRPVSHFLGLTELGDLEDLTETARHLDAKRLHEVLSFARFKLQEQAAEEAEKKRIFQKMLDRIELLAAIEEATVEQRQRVLDDLTNRVLCLWAERAGYDVSSPLILIDQPFPFRSDLIGDSISKSLTGWP